MLLTNLRRHAERVRTSPSLGVSAPFWASQRGRAELQRKALSTNIGHFEGRAGPSVYRKAERIPKWNPFGSANMGEFEALSGDHGPDGTRWHQMASDGRFWRELIIAPIGI